MENGNKKGLSRQKDERTRGTTFIYVHHTKRQTSFGLSNGRQPLCHFLHKAHEA